MQNTIPTQTRNAEDVRAFVGGLLVVILIFAAGYCVGKLERELFVKVKPVATKGEGK